jgi:hypothetical protein
MEPSSSATTLLIVFLLQEQEGVTLCAGQVRKGVHFGWALSYPKSGIFEVTHSLFQEVLGCTSRLGKFLLYSYKLTVPWMLTIRSLNLRIISFSHIQYFPPVLHTCETGTAVENTFEYDIWYVSQF